MTLAPKDYIVERRREISQRMQALNDELVLLDKMESALGEVALTPLPAAVARSGSPPNTPKRRMRFEQGIKGMVLGALQEAKTGLTAQQIIAAIQTTFGYDLPRTSLSPQLTRLKRDGKVTVRDSIWTITLNGLTGP